MASIKRPQPTGRCWCGCGGKTGPSAFFLSRHDAIAVSSVILAHYGGVPEFLLAHDRGPAGKDFRRGTAA